MGYTRSIFIGDSKSVDVVFLDSGMRLILKKGNTKEALFEGELSLDESSKIRALIETDLLPLGTDRNIELRLELVRQLSKKTQLNSDLVQCAFIAEQDNVRRGKLNTVKVKADSELGYTIINAREFDPAYHQLTKDMTAVSK